MANLSFVCELPRRRSRAIQHVARGKDGTAAYRRVYARRLRSARRLPDNRGTVTGQIVLRRALAEHLTTRALEEDKALEQRVKELLAAVAKQGDGAAAAPRQRRADR
jgi:hypothetical protein